jgi:outer membrane PBP1 activator LpoA protein
VIALNDLDQAIERSQKNWTSLSLQPEDEARQIADIAFGRACRHAIVVATRIGAASDCYPPLKSAGLN